MAVSSRVRWWAAFVLGFLVGVIVGILLLEFPFEIDKKFSVSDVLGLLVTLTVAFLIDHFLKERVGTDRAEKELLIMNAKEVLTLGQKLILAIRTTADHQKITPSDFRRIVSIFKTVGMAVETLEHCLQHAGMPKDSTRRLTRTLSACKDAVTGGNFPKDPIDAASLAKYESLYQTFVRQLNELILDINRNERG